MPPVGFEPTISAGEWPQTYALDRAVTGAGNSSVTAEENFTKRDIWGVYSKFILSCQIQLKLEGVRGSGVKAGGLTFCMQTHTCLVINIYQNRTFL